MKWFIYSNPSDMIENSSKVIFILRKLVLMRQLLHDDP